MVGGFWVPSYDSGCYSVVSRVPKTVHTILLGTLLGGLLFLETLTDIWPYYPM